MASNDIRKRKLSFSGTTISVRPDCKRIKLDPIIFFPTRQMFLQSMVKQQFSLPYPIIKHMWENPSSAKGFQKLVQSCKMFFIKNPLIVVPEWYCLYKKGKWQTNVDCTSKMVWPSEVLYAISYVPCRLSGALEKVFKCDINHLSLARLTCSTAELSFISSKCTRIVMDDVTILDENGAIAPLENFFGIFKNVKCFISMYLHYVSHLITPNTVSELIKMANFSTVDKFFIDELTEHFDINIFYNHLKTLGKKDIFQLRFVSQLSAPYKKRLQEIIDEIRDSGGEDIQFFKIRFHGMAEADLLRLFNVGRSIA